MKLLSLFITFFGFASLLSAQHLHTTLSTNDVDVKKPSVVVNACNHDLQKQADGLFSVDIPVTFKSFQVDRLRTKVDLVWETTFEMNNAGFEVQRRAGQGDWQKVAFVFSQAVDGNSKKLLTYEFTDVNIIKEGSDYRLKQLDKKKQTSYSETRSIKGY